MFDDDEDEIGFFQRHRGVLPGTALVLLAGSALTARCLIVHRTVTTVQPAMTIVAVPSPPPLAKPKLSPPPTKPESKPAQRMIPTTAGLPRPASVNINHPKPPDPGSPPALTSTIHGGNSLANLAGSGPEGIGGIGGGPDGVDSGNQYGAFLSSVQTGVEEALHINPRTRRARMKLTVRIWPDPMGRVIKARISHGSGDAAMDRLIEDRILPGMRLASAPPPDMPLPIVMNVTAERP